MSPKKIRKLLTRKNRIARILIVRNDGLGDFLLSLPFISSLKKQLPDSRIFVLVNRSVSLLLPAFADIDGSLVDDGILLKRHRSLFSKQERKEKLRELEMEIRAYNFDACIMLYAESRSSLLIRNSGIPVRIGPGRRWFFYRFNARFSRSRRTSNKSEYSLNLAYLHELGLRADYTRPRLREVTPDFAGLLPARKGRKKLAVLHPYKRNATALSWPVENFVRLSGLLREKGYRVVAMGDRQDEEVLKQMFAKEPEVDIITELSLRQSFSLIASAAVFIGNSSGPLHLAGLAGTPHVGLFPQNHVSSIFRWKTLPPEAGPPFRHYLLQSSFDKNCRVCEKEKCAFFNCVSSIPVEKVVSAVEEWEALKKKKKSPTGGTARRTKAVKKRR